jgi:methyl-accepting chemotaxis protein
MFQQLSLKHRILGFVFVAAFLLGAAGIFSFTAFREQQQNLQYFGTSGRAQADSLANLRSENFTLMQTLWAAHSQATASAARKAQTEAATAQIKKFDEDLQQLQKTAAPGSLGSHFEEVQKTWSELKEPLSRSIQQLEQGSPESDQEEAGVMKDEVAPRSSALADSLLATEAAFKAHGKTALEAAEAKASRMAYAIAAALLLALSYLFISGFFLAKGLSKSLRQTAGRLGAGAESLLKTAGTTTAASQDLLKGVTQQAEALQQIGASIEQTSSMVAKTAENAKGSAEISRSSEASAKKGRDAVAEVIQSIQSISEGNMEIMRQVEESNRDIREIVKLISEIGNKTKVINDIVFQTRLLSFNASVEAARAGEHGKGFAVVAEEVGNLAQMSGNASREISELLANSIQRVEQIVKETGTKVERLTEDSKRRVEGGTETARRCSEALEEIVNNVGKVGSMISEISLASQEQASGVSEINKAMSHLDQVTQKNTEVSRGSAVAAEEINTQSTIVKAAVDDLFAIVEGGKRSVPPAASPVEVRETEAPRKVVTEKKVKKAAVPEAPLPEPGGKLAEVVPLNSGGSDKAVKVESAHPRLKVRAAKTLAEGLPMADDPRFKDV